METNFREGHATNSMLCRGCAKPGLGLIGFRAFGVYRAYRVYGLGFIGSIGFTGFRV